MDAIPQGCDTVEKDFVAGPPSTVCFGVKPRCMRTESNRPRMLLSVICCNCRCRVSTRSSGLANMMRKDHAASVTWGPTFSWRSTRSRGTRWGVGRTCVRSTPPVGSRRQDRESRCSLPVSRGCNCLQYATTRGSTCTVVLQPLIRCGVFGRVTSRMISPISSLVMDSWRRASNTSACSP